MRYTLLLILIPAVIWAGACETVAYSYLQALASGDYQKAFDMSTEQMKEALPSSKLEAIWKQLQRVYGEYRGVLEVRSFRRGKYDVCIFKTAFGEQGIAITISVDEEGKIAGLYFKPVRLEKEYTPPSYIDTVAFYERDVRVGELGLRGKVCVPKGVDNPSVLVFVHGSGPNDMNETIGPNEVFKDLAWGLASMGVASLRYNKRTYERPDAVDPKSITVEEEVLEDAIAAVKLAKKLFPKSKVFVLGHSLGAYLAPYIAETSGADGVVMLAPPARDLAEVMLDQLEYLKDFEPVDEKVLELVEKLAKGKLSPSTVVLGAPASYYYDLKKYNPLKYLRMPALLIFGGKDYQVTLKEKDIFEEKMDGTIDIKVFPNLNHLFMEVEGKPTPADYFKEGHVCRCVIECIAKWVKEVER